MGQTFESAVHLFFLRQDKILLLLRRNTGYMDGHYSLVAGGIEPGETVVRAAIREAQEEVGITLHPQDIEVVQTMHRRDDYERIEFFVRVRQWDAEPYNAEPEKCSELAWFPIDRLPENTVPYIHQAVENYQRCVCFCSFGWD